VARYYYAWCFYQLGQEKRALKEFESFLINHPQSDLSPHVMYWIGEYYHDRAKFTKAEEHFRKILAEFPHSQIAADAYYSLSWTLHASGDIEGALNSMNKFAELFPDSPLVPDVMLRSADILIQQKHHDRALVRFQELVENYADSPYQKTAYRKMGMIYKEQKSYDEAITHFRGALGTTTHEMDAQVQFQIGECFEERDDLDSAIEEYLKVSYTYPESAFWSLRSKLRCAQIFERLGKLQDAEKLYVELSTGDTAEAEYAKERLEWMQGMTE
jgi:TolA-binding protein